MNSTAALFSLFRSQESIKNADVILLLIDAQKGPQKDTRLIYQSIRDAQKGCIILVNKWDTVSGLPMEDYKKRLLRECGFFHNTPIFFISALTGRNVDFVMAEAYQCWENVTISVSTKELNDFLEEAKRHKAPPPTVRFKYIVQAGINPPTFVLFVKNIRSIPKHYITYLINALIHSFSLTGIIPRLVLKEEKK